MVQGKLLLHVLVFCNFSLLITERLFLYRLGGMFDGEIHTFRFILSVRVIIIWRLQFRALTTIFLITIIYKVHLKICVLKNFLTILWRVRLNVAIFLLLVILLFLRFFLLLFSFFRLLKSYFWIFLLNYFGQSGPSLIELGKSEV